MDTMTDQRPRQKLPLELILHIVDLLAPPFAVALKSDDPTTRCIRSFTTVCRATYPPALRLLYKHCLYIDSSERLRRLLVTLNNRLAPTPSSTCEYADADPSLSLSLSLLQPTPPSLLSLPQVDIQPHLQNLYLAPFPASTIDDLPTAEWVFELFCLMRHSLRRLVSGMDMHSLALWRDHLNVRARLRAAFAELTAVEEFVSLYDDLDLLPDEQSWLSAAYPSNEVPVWLGWSNLRRLSLRKCNMYRPVYSQLEKLPQLETIVMVANFCFEQEGWNRVFDNFTRGRGHDVNLLWPACPQTPRWTDRFTCHGSFLERLEYARVWNERRRSSVVASPGLAAMNGVVYDEDVIDEEDEGGSGARKRRNSEVKLKALAVDEMYAPGEQKRGLLHLQTWIMDRAVDGTLFEVGESARFKRSCLNPDYWVDAGRDGGRWMGN